MRGDEADEGFAALTTGRSGSLRQERLADGGSGGATRETRAESGKVHLG